MNYRPGATLVLSFLMVLYSPVVSKCQSSDSILSVLSNNLHKDDGEKYNLLCDLIAIQVEPDSIIKYCELAIVHAEESKINPSWAYSYKGFALLNAGKLTAALDCFLTAAKYDEMDGDQEGLAIAYTYIGETYNMQDNYDNAIHYYKNALDIFSKDKDTISQAFCLHNLAYISYSMGLYDTALVLYDETSELYLKSGYLNEYEVVLGNEGLVYSRLNEIQKAEAYLLRAIEKLTEQAEIGYEMPVTEFMIEYASILQQKGEIQNAIEAVRKSYQMASKHKLLEFERDAAYRLARLFEVSNKFDSAYYYQSVYISANDSINSVKSIQEMADLRTEFEVARKQTEVEVLEKNKLIQIIVILGLALILLLAIGLILMYSYNLKRSKKLNFELDERNNLLELQGNELRFQHAELKEQKDQIEIQSKETTASINYAKRIQSAILPSSEVLECLLPDHFILFKPRDIVSGDFYWIKQIKNFTIVVAADCTGHGVPGAFMSMLGISMLNEIVGRSRLDSAGEFLDRLRKKVKTTLSQEGKELEQKDGMDLSLAIFDADHSEMQFAGAFNSIYLVRNNKSANPDLAQYLAVEADQHNLYEIKGDRQPISIYSNEIEFNTHYVKLEKNDTLYMFSDGYPDQIGGPNEKKFMVRKFKTLLLEIQSESMQNQQKILDTTLQDWKKAVKQIDDILVIGIRW